MELLKALFESADLPTDFKEKTKTLFEAAVDEKVKSELVSIQESYDKQLSAAREAFITESTNVIDSVVEETVLEWAKENAVGLDSELKGQIAESFLGGLKAVFEKADIELSGGTAGKELVKLQESNAALAKEAAETKAALTEAQDQLVQIKIKEIVESATEGLADTQVHRVKKLLEAFDFKSAEDFKSKAEMVVEAVSGIVAVNDNGSGNGQPVPPGGSNVSNTVDTSSGAAGAEDGELVVKPGSASVKSAEGDKGTPSSTQTTPVNIHEAAPHLHADLIAETMKLFR